MNNGKSKPSTVSRWFGRLWNSPLPQIGCEISHPGISIARWARSSSRLETAAWKPLPAGVVEASPLRENIQKPEEVHRVFGEALSAVGISAGAGASKRMDAVLLIPDQAARIFVLNFDKFPDRFSEGLPLVKWRLKKSLPFDIESAAISYFVQRSGSELQVIAVASPERIIRQYEAVAERFGLRPRCVTLSTLASLGLLGALQDNSNGHEEPAAQPGVLVAKYSPPWFTTAILQGGALRLLRTVGLAQDDEGLLSTADVLSSVYPSLAYFQDNFQGTVARGYLCGLGENNAIIAAELERELNLGTSSLVPDGDWIASVADPHRAERHFAALLGIVQEQQNG